jgi:hypothetical protein
VHDVGPEEGEVWEGGVVLGLDGGVEVDGEDGEGRALKSQDYREEALTRRWEETGWRGDGRRWEEMRGDERSPSVTERSYDGQERSEAAREARRSKRAAAVMARARGTSDLARA